MVFNYSRLTLKAYSYKFPVSVLLSPVSSQSDAFLNDKLDLAQASIADLIDASSEQAARSAINSLQGAFLSY